MGFIPKEARWYLADLVLEYTIEGDDRNLVHVNIHLIEAESPEQAHRKAQELGKAGEMTYLNTDAKTVRVTFRGLRDLNVIHDDLEHGAELCYEEKADIPEEELLRWVRPREQLSIFVPRQVKGDGPNTMPEEVMELLEAEGFNREGLLGYDGEHLD